MNDLSKDELHKMIEQYQQSMMEQYGSVRTSDDSPVTAEESTKAVVVDIADNTTDNDYVPTEELTDIGKMQIRVSTENQAVPIVGAVVTVSHRQNGDTVLDRVLFSDQSGLTEIIELPTKDRRLSLTPANPAPYKAYTVDVEAAGYFPKRFADLPIYGGVTAIQNVSLIPLPEAGGQDLPTEYQADDIQ